MNVIIVKQNFLGTEGGETIPASQYNPSYYLFVFCWWRVGRK